MVGTIISAALALKSGAETVGRGIEDRGLANYAQANNISPEVAEAIYDNSLFNGDTAINNISNQIRTNVPVINAGSSNQLLNQLQSLPSVSHINTNSGDLGIRAGQAIQDMVDFNPLARIKTGWDIITGKSKKREAEYNAAVDSYNRQLDQMVRNNQLNLLNKSMFNAQQNYFDIGGSLEGQNGVTKFNTGNTHENNPYGGIQQGIASDGKPNLVEEGEIKYKDYIYSKRIKPSKALLKKNNLPEKYAGLSYAEIADKLQQESEDRPNDPISIGTLDAWMERLQNAQEETRTTNSMRRAAKLIDGMSDEEKMGILAMMQGEEQPIMASGGKISIKESKKGTFTAAAKKHGKSVQEFASQVLAHPENYSEVMRKKAQFARNAKSWSHAEGGYLVGQTYDVSEEEYNRLKQLGYGIEIV